MKVLMFVLGLAVGTAGASNAGWGMYKDYHDWPAYCLFWPPPNSPETDCKAMVSTGKRREGDTGARFYFHRILPAEACQDAEAEAEWLMEQR
jgi:hypothetical protein